MTTTNENLIDALPPAVAEALEKILDYNWRDECRHYLECKADEGGDEDDGVAGVPDHIYWSLRAVSDYFEGEGVRENTWDESH